MVVLMMSFDTTDFELLHRDPIAASLIFVIGICGLVANFFSLRIIYKLPALHNCFGYLCFVHALGEAGVLAIFVFWATSMAIIETEISHDFIGKKFGQAILICYFVTLYAQLLKAVNRLVAISSPVNYRKIFNEFNAKFFVAAVICIACCHGIIYFFDGCDFYFDSYTLVWTFESSPCGRIISFYIDFIFGCSFMLFVIFIDVCTLCFIQMKRNALGQSQLNSTSEIRFFIQTCLTSILYTIMLASFHIVSTLNTNKWHVFLCTSIAWELCHMIDAFIVIAFNVKLKQKHSPKISKVQSHSTRATLKATTRTTVTAMRIVFSVEILPFNSEDYDNVANKCFSDLSEPIQCSSNLDASPATTESPTKQKKTGIPAPQIPLA